MILQNMTYNEIAGHLEKDHREVYRYVKGIKFMRYRSEALKLKRYPLYFKPLFFHTTQHNRWFVMPVVREKKDLDIIPYYTGCLFERFNKMALYIQMRLLSDETLLSFIFTDRFFERYAKRVQLNELSQEAVIFEFIKGINKVGIKDYSKDSPSHSILFYDNGIALGHTSPSKTDLVVFHSYVSAHNGPDELQKLHHEWELANPIFNI